MKVVMYVVEEVARQGHNVAILEGIQRVEWMLRAWTFALEARRRPTVSVAIVIGQIIEPEKNRLGLRQCGVWVGSEGTPHFTMIGRLLDDLFERYDTLTPLAFYKEFEEIHPFVDGNGRTGKVLLNWANGTLLDPIFPPANLWGKPILNP